ncbi:MAG: efflux RND transporter periplasmic adaptor subunit, partial [Planctomycetales bacterium]
IRAPFAGLVTERMIEPGEWAGEGQSVMTLVSIDSVEAWLRVPERYLLDLTNNPQGVQVVINNFGTLTPAEVRIISDIDPRSRMFTIVAKLDNSDQKLAPGLSLTGRVPIGKNTPHLVIPVDAVLRTQSGNFIFRAKKAADPSAMSSAERIPVTISFEREGLAYILPDANTALQNDDQVVVEGNDRLQPNQPLMIKTREAEGEAPTKR